jgi:hypothetical protein
MIQKLRKEEHEYDHTADNSSTNESQAWADHFSHIDRPVVRYDSEAKADYYFQAQNKVVPRRLSPEQAGTHISQPYNPYLTGPAESRPVRTRLVKSEALVRYPAEKSFWIHRIVNAAMVRWSPRKSISEKDKPTVGWSPHELASTDAVASRSIWSPRIEDDSVVRWSTPVSTKVQAGQISWKPSWASHLTATQTDQVSLRSSPTSQVNVETVVPWSPQAMANIPTVSSRLSLDRVVKDETMVHYTRSANPQTYQESPQASRNRSVDAGTGIEEAPTTRKPTKKERKVVRMAKMTNQEETAVPLSPQGFINANIV